MQWLPWKRKPKMFMYRRVEYFLLESVFVFNKYGCRKKQVRDRVHPLLKHESASVVCVCGNSQRVEMSTRSEWSFRTFPALFQDSVVPALAPVPALAQSLVPLDTSHRLALPLLVAQSPCGSWDTGKGIRSCRTPVGSCCPACRSLPGNLQVIEEPDWEAPVGSAPPW